MSIEAHRRQTILDALRTAPTSAATLARLTNAPQASVRRVVGDLRDQGHAISNAYDTQGRYALTESGALPPSDALNAL